jgi:ABC-type transport system involved in multi-copper enzyme maturation permease subunit
VTVHARGYRPYGGPFRAAFPALAIALEAERSAVSTRAYFFLRIFFFIWFVTIAFLLYVQLGTNVGPFLVGRIAGQIQEQGMDVESFVLRNGLQIFYGGVAVLTALLAVLVGSGLVADDLGARALALYLVRPIRPLDYVVGKALVIPLVLARLVLLPGLGFYVLVGLWQDSGETLPFLAGNLDVLGLVFRHYALGALSYTGIVLLLSSRSPRRNAVAVLSAAVILGGTLLRTVMVIARAKGPLADALGLAAVPANTLAPFRRAVWPVTWPRGLAYVPSDAAVFTVAGLLFVLGVVAVWRRARSVEVAG